MHGIPIYAPTAEDFSGNGLGLLLPTECTVEEVAAGMYTLTLVQPITSDLRWSLIDNGCIIKANVPVRESPIYESSATTGGMATITRKIYKVSTNGGRLHLRQKPSTSSKILSKWKPGTEVVQLADAGNGWYQVSIVSGGATGYMYASWLKFDREITETITSTAPDVNREGVKVQPSREQLFRVSSVQKDTDAGTVTATAQHIFYDLRGNIVNDEYAPENVSASEAAAHVFSAALNTHDFTVHTPNLIGTVTGDYGYKSIVEALLDPDEGIVAQSDALFVRDNYDVFLLPDEVRDLGVTVRRGKNLIGVTVTHDETNVVTRIVPVGTGKPNKDGDASPLYIDEKYVDSSHIGDYPVVYAKMIEYDVSVASKSSEAKPEEGIYASEADAKAELKKRASAEFESGIDLPDYGMNVDFILLGNSDEYSQYAGLQSVHMFDTVTVHDSLIQLSSKLRVTGYVWDVLTEQYQSVTLGDIQELSQTIYSYNLPTGGISGTKIATGTMGGNVFRDATIGYAKISVAAIETLAANAITAVSAHINDLVAGTIETNQLYADLAKIAVAQITTANITNANIDWAQITNLTAQIATIADAQIGSASIGSAQIADLDVAVADIVKADIKDLNAVIAQIASAEIGSADIGFAQVKDLVTGTAIITEGVGGELYISRLAVTEANMVSLTVGELVVKGTDGAFYSVTVNEAGEIVTSQKVVDNGDINDNSIQGLKIIEGSIDVSRLNAQSIFADSAIVRELIAANLDVGTLFAREAFIAQLNTTDIRGNEYLKLYVTDQLSGVNDQVDSLDARVTSAEQKITPDAIVSTVRSSTAYSNDLAAKANASALSAYAKKTELTQTADSIRAEVSSLGGNNLLHNSGFYFGLDDWTKMEYNVNGDYRTLSVETGANDYRANEVPSLVMQAQNETGNFGVSQEVTGLRKNTDYTISGYVASHRCNKVNVTAANLASTVWMLDTTFETSWGGTNLASYTRFSYTFNTGNYSDVWLAFFSNAYGSNAFVFWAQLKLEEGMVATAWSPHASETYTSSIEIHDNQVDIKTGGSFNVESGAVDISTSDFYLSVQAPNDPENEVISINPDYGRITVDELRADNVRPYASYAEYRLSELGSIREFANILSRTTFAQVSLILDADEYGTTPVNFRSVFANNVSIVSDGTLRRTVPWRIHQTTANFYVDNLSWACNTSEGSDASGNTAIVIFGGNLLLRNCYIQSAYWGIRAYQSSKVSWCGWKNHGAGYCSDMFCIGTEGADIAIYGYVPGSANGTMGAWEAARGLERNVTVLSSSTPPTPTYISTSLTGDLGWISTKHSWATGIAYQGYTTGKGECYACIKFTLPSMSSVLAATLTLHRKSGVGKGDEVDIKLYGSATAWGSRPTLGTLYTSRDDAVLAGKSTSLDVLTAVKALKAGSIVQLVLYEGDGRTLNGKVYSTDYCAWDSATLDLTYTT